MDLLFPSTIKHLLAEHQTKPSKRLGQNFLTSKRALEEIITVAQLNNNDTVVEIGPGIGTLTQELAKHAGQVIAIEKDRAMLPILQKTLAGFTNVEVVHADALSFKFQDSRFKIVANIPYYLTSALIRHFLEARNPPEQMILTIQKEVAQRICAKPGDMSILAVAVQFYAKPKIISLVPAGCFWPAPKIDSAIISITPFAAKRPDVKTFFSAVKAGFSSPRKQLAGNLATSFKKSRKEIEALLLKNNIQPNQRAETLSMGDWENLAADFITL